jgi:hypothetical protein
VSDKTSPKPGRMWAVIVPGQRHIRWGGIFPTSGECWGEAESHWKSANAWSLPAPSRAGLKRLGYRVLRVTVAADGR